MLQREIDVLIAGAGIAGLLLARDLQKQGRRVLVAHDSTRTGAGEAAVGLLNPVRGRRYTLAWRATEVFAEAAATYRAVGASTGSHVFRPLPILRAFSSPQERALWTKRAPAVEAAGFLHRESTNLPAGFRARRGEGAVEIHGGGIVHPRVLLDVLRAEQRARGALIDVPCSGDDCEPHVRGLLWKAGDVSAARLVLAGGAADFAAVKARGLALRPVKGETLVIHAPGLDDSIAYVCGHHLAPLGGGMWICGGTKVPGDDTAGPTDAGRAELTAFLHDHLDTSWEIAAQWSGVRAVSMDTRPVAGPLGDDDRVFVLNGLGSQGFAIGPWVARILADHLCQGVPLPVELRPDRFAPPVACAGGEPWSATDVLRELVLKHLVPGDAAIDLTVGAGGDTVWLAQAVGADGTLFGLDVQAEAIALARQRLEHLSPEATIELICADHAEVADVVPPGFRGRIGAAVGSLGLLPGSTSPVSTRASSTLRACAGVLPLLRVGGVLAIVVPAGNAVGREELAALECWAAQLNRTRHVVTWRHSPDGAARAGAVLAIARCAE